MNSNSEMPSTEEIETRYHHAFSNLGFRTARERVLPISGDKTDEEKILADTEAEDDDAFIEGLKQSVRSREN